MKNLVLELERVPDLKDACGDLPYEYIIRHTCAVAGPKEPFTTFT
jgi:hypothetical protein